MSETVCRKVFTLSGLLTRSTLVAPVDELTPWYAYYRKALLSKRLRTEYETFGHPVACRRIYTYRHHIGKC
jgi:hypothetical protein